MKNWIVVIILAGVAACASPLFDYAFMSIKLDEIAYKICNKRFGPFFPQRWSCESTIRGNAFMFALGCAFKGDSENLKDICEEFQAAQKEDEPKAKPNTPPAASIPDRALSRQEVIEALAAAGMYEKACQDSTSLAPEHIKKLARYADANRIDVRSDDAKALVEASVVRLVGIVKEIGQDQWCKITMTWMARQ
jgi:hypothetical protein